MVITTYEISCNTSNVQPMSVRELLSFHLFISNQLERSMSIRANEGIHGTTEGKIPSLTNNTWLTSIQLL